MADVTSPERQRVTHPVLGYRPEIDGLRSIAVIAVVLFHYHVPGFAGGFIGVDVFFVISGFLIGGLLWKEYEEQRSISLIDFYIRRFRRLAPAYIVMGAVVFAAGYALLLPSDFRELGKELIAATTYIANIAFYRSAGYFDIGAEEKPLLHTWTLSLEEQFYLFLPLFILLFARSRQTLLTGLIAVGAVSLALSAIFTSQHQTAAFYLFPYRAWEFLAGVLLAIYSHRGQAFGAWMSWLGLALLAVAIFLLSPKSMFPGVLAVLPVAGTVLLILNGEDANAVNRLLSSKVPVTIGLASYSLYLWHWPVLVLSLAWRDTYTGPAETLGWIALSFVLGWLSWRFVEIPTRNRRRVSAGMIVGGTLLGSSMLIALGGVAFLSQGWPGRWHGSVLAHSAASQDFLQDFSRCHVAADGPFKGIDVCSVGPEGEPKFLAWGDSHLRAMMDGLKFAALDAGVPGLIVWSGGCPPLFGLEKQESAATRHQDAECTRYLRQMSQAVASVNGIESVLLVGRWSYYAEGRGVGADDHNTIVLSPDPEGTLGKQQRAGAGQAALYAEAVDATIERLLSLGKRILVLRQVPEVPLYGSRRVARLVAYGRIADEAELAKLTEVSRADAIKRADQGNAPFERAAADGRIVLIDSWGALCGETKCGVMGEDRSLYFDNNHLTNLGALTLRPIFAPLFGPAGLKPPAVPPEAARGTHE